jgi:GntR family transcriptional regulator
MKLEVDLHSHVPIYIQVVERIKHMIATGQLAPGEQLPTVRQLARDLKVNFNTVARAYSLLDDASIISTQQGRGSFVRERPDEDELAQHRAETLRKLVGYAILQAFSLGYKPGEIRGAFEDTVRQLEHERDG